MSKGINIEKTYPKWKFWSGRERDVAKRADDNRDGFVTNKELDRFVASERSFLDPRSDSPNAVLLLVAALGSEETEKNIAAAAKVGERIAREGEDVADPSGD